jgi:outer membrane protein OmpA-like peptidoglycan-associated protein
LAARCIYTPVRLLAACAFALLLALLGGCTALSPADPRAGAEPSARSSHTATPTLLTVNSEAELASRRARLSASGEALAANTVGYYLDVQRARLQTLFPEGVDIKRAGDHIRLVIPGAGSFDTDSTVLTPAMQAKLDKLASLLGEYQQSLVLIAGHSDNRGDAAYNRLLSRDRAMAVGRYLDKQGAAANRMVVRGFGDRRPIADNASPEGRAANRRIELELWPLIAADAAATAP